MCSYFHCSLTENSTLLLPPPCHLALCVVCVRVWVVACVCVRGVCCVRVPRSLWSGVDWGSSQYRSFLRLSAVASAVTCRCPCVGTLALVAWLSEGVAECVCTKLGGACCHGVGLDDDLLVSFWRGMPRSGCKQLRTVGAGYQLHVDGRRGRGSARERRRRGCYPCGPGAWTVQACYASALEAWVAATVEGQLCEVRRRHCCDG